MNRHFRRTSLLLIASTFAFVFSSFDARDCDAQGIPDDVKLIDNVSYRSGSNACKLDLLIPKNLGDSTRPAIVFVHGGGWRNGDKRRGYFFSGAIEYAQKGYVCATINYRLTGEAPFPACIEDTKCAIRFLRANADKYHIDPDLIGAYGNSAGAHLVSMLGLATKEAGLEGDGPHQDQSSAVQAVVASATPTDFLNWSGKETSIRQLEQRFRSSEKPAKELASLSSPITHVSADAPPFLLIHGTADRTVPYRQGKSFHDALKKAGAKDVELITIEGAGHGVFNQHAPKTHPAMEKFFARFLGTPESK
ncbi:alpha/beta hydrolase [Stieleria sp. JC731]|uniref:alpha/beta hydrolase n=1 Tax=Pirellulaceae TaxID=2691357 RepID=UPI001E3BA00A|nr:alpha/beta hydrolase [Stieleria sp. JC731]MCC9603313.1 alpha/beta hydrolase [Stieleria sp. JC731]